MSILIAVFGGLFLGIIVYLIVKFLDGGNDMCLKPSLYQILKWLCVIVLPALATFIVVISKIWGWADLGTMIAQTITAVATFLGTILCISNYNYYKGENKG
jgi:hypothetical protein